MFVKSKLETSHLQHLTEVFKVLKNHKLRLNVEKCTFEVGSGKFLGHLVSRRGIEAFPTQMKVIEELKSPTTIREVQKLTGMVGALNRFIN